MIDRRIFIDLVAIACWIVLWVGTPKIGMELGKWVMDPEGLRPLGDLLPDLLDRWGRECTAR